MLLWIVLALMTGAAVLTVLWPLSARPKPAPAEDATDVAFYRDQLHEIDREQERGALSGQEAEGARIEAGRRLLRATAAVTDETVDAASEPALRRQRAASAMALCVVPLVGLAVYGAIGSPQLPDQPLSARLDAGQPQFELAAAIARIEAHLAANPADGRGWEVIAPVYLRSGRPAEAARAYAEASRFSGPSVERALGEGEALMLAEGGRVTAEARLAFERAGGLDPDHPKVRYYLALAAEQGGDIAGAAVAYRALVESAAADAPWLPAVRARLERLAPGPATRGPAVALSPGAVTPDIAAMVGGLDRRLAAGGGTEPDWSRLVRSLVVLGRRDEALERLGRARLALDADGDALARLDRLASELGLTAEVARR